jgi:hypothetical protein
MIILFTVVTQGFFVPAESRGTFDTSLLTINDGIFQAIGVISFGMLFPVSTMTPLPLQSQANTQFPSIRLPSQLPPNLRLPQNPNTRPLLPRHPL